MDPKPERPWESEGDLPWDTPDPFEEEAGAEREREAWRGDEHQEDWPEQLAGPEYWLYRTWGETVSDGEHSYNVWRRICEGDWRLVSCLQAKSAEEAEARIRGSRRQLQSATLRALGVGVVPTD